MKHYFKYEIKEFSGYRKVSEQSDIKSLMKCKFEGFSFIRNSGRYILFSVNNQLYRLLKLSQIGNESTYAIRFLNFMIQRSKKIEQSEIQDNYSYWYNSADYTYDFEVKTKKQEYKDRLASHNNQYKNKYKLKR